MVDRYIGERLFGATRPAYFEPLNGSCRAKAKVDARVARRSKRSTSLHLAHFDASVDPQSQSRANAIPVAPRADRAQSQPLAAVAGRVIEHGEGVVYVAAT